MEIVAESPPAVNVASGSAEDAVRGTVSNSTSSTVSSVIGTLVHCRAGGGPIELPEANVSGLVVAVKSEPADRKRERFPWSIVSAVFAH